MKSPLPLLTPSLLLTFCTSALAGFGPVPNGDFESPPGDAGAWDAVNEGGVYEYSYPDTDGNPGGYGIIDNTGGGGGFGIWVSNYSVAIPLTDLGLVPGQACTFLQDMRILAGSHIGGFKVDFFAADVLISSTGDLYPASGSAEWATYSFPVTIPAGADGIKIVPLWGPDSSVGYDNIRLKEPEPLVATIKAGTLVSWSATAGRTYQPQESSDQLAWTNLGSVISGATPLSRLDESPAPYYRVVEVIPGGGENLVLNPGFEEPDGNTLGAANWAIATQPNTGASMSIVDAYGTTLPHGGEHFLLIESTTAPTGPVAAPNTDVRSVTMAVNAGTAYQLSFYAANPVKTGGANPQYHVFYYNEANGLVGGPIFTSFSTVGAAWTKITKTFTPPAGATKLTIGWIQAMGAGNDWHWVTLIDDVALTTGTGGPDVTNLLPATAAAASEITWNSTPGVNYQLQSSTALTGWNDLGSPVTGTGGPMQFSDLRNGPKQFYRVVVP